MKRKSFVPTLDLERRMQKRLGFKITDAKTFGDYLVYVYFSDDPLAMMLRDRNDTKLKDWGKIWGQKGVIPLVRGMHGLPANVKTLKKIKNPPKNDWSWSYNPAYTVKNFCRAAGPRMMARIKEDRFMLGKGVRAEVKGKLTLQSLREAEAAVLITASIDVAKPGNDWGGDSESGPFMEAEIRTTRCNDERCFSKVFVATRRRLALPLATKAERHHYCLGYWNEISGLDVPWATGEFTIYLHPDVDTSVFKGAKVKKVRKDPAGRTWYRLR